MHKILVTIVVVPLLFYVLPVAFDFFGIPSKAYMVYVVWLMALLILHAILPSRLPNMFAKTKT